MPDSPTSNATDRTLDILEAVARLGVCQVADVARETGLPASTIHRIVSRLVERGYLTSPRRGYYMAGTTLFSLGKAARIELRIAEAARPLLARFGRSAGLHTHLGILQKEMVSYLVICSNGQHPISSTEGTQLEAYCSGIGKALLASAPSELRSDYLAKGDFVALTPNTITDPFQLAEQLETIRHRGYALDDEEIVPGLRCVAVPVFDRTHRAIAAISASGPAHLLTPDKIAKVWRGLSKIAERLLTSDQ